METAYQIDSSPWAEPGRERFRGLSFAGRKVEVAPGLISARERRFRQLPVAELGGGLALEVEATPHLPENLAFVQRVLRRAGLNTAAYRVDPLVRRIPACLRALKVESLAEALQEIDASQTRLLEALNALLIGTTAFFRDRAVFEELDRQIIPDLLRRRARPRVWSAACSDGAELYSVAMLLDWHGARYSTLLGTDCRTSALAKARAGCYPIATVAEVPGRFLRKYFEDLESGVSVDESIRAQVTWDQADVMKEGAAEATTMPDSLGWDMIFCRNLAIYLEPEPMRRLWERLSSALVPGGYLVVGRAELPALDHFSGVAPCIYQKNLSP